MSNIELRSELLTCLRVSDSSFPGGNFGFSNGLEAVINPNEKVDESTLAELVSDLVENRWKTADCVSLRKCYDAIDDLLEVCVVDREFDTFNTSDVARDGSIKNGRALLSTAATLGGVKAKQYLKLIKEDEAIGHIPIAQSLYWHDSGIDESQAIHLSLYSTVSNYCQVAVRLGAVGALQAQRILTRVLASFSLTEPPEFWLMAPSSFTPYSDIATHKLSQQDLRLFRN